MGITTYIINKTLNKSSRQSTYNYVTKRNDDHGKHPILLENAITQTI